jgi:heme exporter protein A
MLAVRALTCRRGERLVFAGVAFAVAPGGALLLRGSNGSGKSTLLRCLAGLLAPVAGAVLWDGRPAADDAEAFRARLHYLGHLDGLKPALTLRENLRFWQSLRGSADPALAEQGLVHFALAALADLPAALLSAGQRRRLALARLLASPASLWLLDEPNAALDEESHGRLAAALDRHRAGGGIVAVAVHGGFTLPGATVLALDEFRPPPEAASPW